MKELNPYSRITLDVPNMGKITADYYTFNAICLALIAEIKDAESKMLYGISKRCTVSRDYIYNELDKRGFYADL